MRSDGVAQIAEFFFVLRDAGLTSPTTIAGFLRRHNDDMQALLDSCSRGYTRFGLSAARIREAMFQPHQIDLIVHESSGERATFDQRSIGKILTQVMSFESCRTLLVLMASAGLLQRRDFRSVVLISFARDDRGHLPAAPAINGRGDDRGASGATRGRDADMRLSLIVSAAWACLAPAFAQDTAGIGTDLYAGEAECAAVLREFHGRQDRSPLALERRDRGVLRQPARRRDGADPGRRRRRRLSRR